ncbi:alpha/beta hydrolase [Paenibacillus sp. HB172176]|uniref:alpha/beta hydrolase n=1 Tax=Paenibacillus sp. HB172176 TaxID=2493690 RepID=UPI00143BDADC|nr:alpha/beta hydrolase [Paenibacillus sp. HB172176]
MIIETIILNEQRNVALTRYGLDSSHELANADARPSVLIFPGGGYYGCSDREAEPIAVAYLAEGFNAFVLRYSVAEHAAWPHPLEDAQQALSLLRDNGERWKLISNQIAVVGFSAGGHLAAALGTIGACKPDALILAYPVILDKSGENYATRIPSLDERVTSATPPVFLFSTRNDKLVPIVHSLRLLSALEAHDIPFESHLFESGAHGLSLAKPHTASGFRRFVDDDAAQWLRLSVRWLHKRFSCFETK